MKKLFLYIVVCLLSNPLLHSQQAIGTWRTHLSYHNTTRTEPAGDIIYALSNGSLFSYDKEDTGIRLYDKVNTLSDTDISFIAYSSENKMLVIFYSNANIDLLVNDEDIYNLPDYKNKILPYNKEVNTIRFHNEYAYLTTSFGILQINLKKKEITNTFVLNKHVNDCSVEGNQLIAATDEGLYLGVLTHNLLDVNNWKKVSDDIYTHICYYDNTLIGNIIPVGIHLINKETYTSTLHVNGKYTYMNMYNSLFLCGNEDVFLPFSAINKYNYLEYNASVYHISYANNTYWVSYRDEGLVGQKLNTNNNKLESITLPIIPNSPIRNLPYYMSFAGERLLIAGGGITNNRLDNRGTIMMMENNTWYNFEEKNIEQQTGLAYKDITSIVQDPKDSEHYFASSAGEGLYEFKNKKFVKLYNLHNSPLETALPNDPSKDNYLRINGLKYDRNNNLWMLNSEAEHSIHVLKEDGNWVNFHFPETTDLTNFEHIHIDRRGWIWATSSWIVNAGVFCLNTNNTLENIADDQYRFITNFTNQDGTLLPQNGIHCIVEDKNGSIWIGTDKGPIVLNSPSRFFDNNFYCMQIKVSRNDGSGYADFLLANDIINAIAIDGANRKWIGTESNGIYLISEDGQETIHHFTEQNSRLLSNNITSITISRSGEVFIGTNKGLISYQSDATEAEETFSNNIHAYPNPVKPGYDGLITVTGMVRDSDVKIADAAGNVVYSGTSLGGQFTWDGRNLQGRRIASGVYFVLAADSNGKEGVVTKIVIIR